MKSPQPRTPSHILQTLSEITPPAPNPLEQRKAAQRAKKAADKTEAETKPPSAPKPKASFKRKVRKGHKSKPQPTPVAKRHR
eukprot:9223955-Alexandrium_andersonii.AAC.1